MLNVQGVVFVTGAGSGIGRATALAFARAGVAGIHITDIDRKALNETESLLQAEDIRSSLRVLSSQMDVTNECQVISTLGETIMTFGRLDYAVNVAGIFQLEPETADLSLELFDHINGVNQRGALICMREELRVMRIQEPLALIPGRPAVRGAITNISSTTAIKVRPHATSYVTSKHAVIGMTRSAATCHALEGIRVNAVCPGYVDTPMSRFGEDTSNTAFDFIPQQRAADPQEIADVILFLTSGYASYVTGAAWVVDGGMTIT